MPKYTQDGIFGQMLVAFGHGTGGVRVSHEAVAELRKRYYDWIGKKEILEDWENTAVQFLERFEAIGRLAARLAAESGRTTVQKDDITQACQRVETSSGTDDCPPP